MFTYKSNHIKARQEVLGTTFLGGIIVNPEDALVLCLRFYLCNIV